MPFKVIKYVIKISILISALGMMALLAIHFYVNKSTSNLIIDDIEVIDIEKRQTGLILGAYVRNDGQLSNMFEDRVNTAIALYKAGKIEKILISGDHGTTDYDEVNAARKFILSKGVKAEDVFLDHAGFDTYDSLYRAKHIFEVEDIYVITQNFHLPRAVYIAKSLGIDAKGAAADRREYLGIKYNYLREIPANGKAFLNVVFKSKSTYLGEAIPITGDSKKAGTNYN